MRRIMTFDWLTADGYFAGLDGNLKWVVPDNEQAKAAAQGPRLSSPAWTTVSRTPQTLLLRADQVIE